MLPVFPLMMNVSTAGHKMSSNSCSLIRILLYIIIKIVQHCSQALNTCSVRTKLSDMFVYEDLYGQLTHVLCSRFQMTF